jgi:hypothetical protein
MLKLCCRVKGKGSKVLSRFEVEGSEFFPYMLELWCRLEEKSMKDPGSEVEKGLEGSSLTFN